MLLLALFACNGTDGGDSADTDKDTNPDVNAPPVVINEFLASNATGYTDEAGEYDDWVEIYNTGDTLVQLDGLYLSDDRQAQPTRWAFPDGQGIDAHSYFLVWCDAQVEQGTNHASFKLNKSGDQLNIFYVEGGNDPVQVDAITYEEQTTDMSFARVPDGSLEWVQGTPTPNATNGQ